MLFFFILLLFSIYLFVCFLPFSPCHVYFSFGCATHHTSIPQRNACLSFHTTRCSQRTVNRHCCRNIATTFWQHCCNTTTNTFYTSAECACIVATTTTTNNTTNNNNTEMGIQAKMPQAEGGYVSLQNAATASPLSVYNSTTEPSAHHKSVFDSMKRAFGHAIAGGTSGSHDGESLVNGTSGGGKGSPIIASAR